MIKVSAHNVLLLQDVWNVRILRHALSVIKILNFNLHKIKSVNVKMVTGLIKEFASNAVRRFQDVRLAVKMEQHVSNASTLTKS